MRLGSRPKIDPVDMVEEGYDLVIRVNPEPDANLVGRIFLRDRLVVVASPAVTRPRGKAVSRPWCAGRPIRVRIGM